MVLFYFISTDRWGDYSIQCTKSQQDYLVSWR